MSDVRRLFDPINPGEEETFELDFTEDMDVDEGETITSATWACTVRSGLDSAAAACISGGAVVTNDHLMTRQFCKGFKAGVVYILAATVITNKGNKKTISAGLPCQAIA